MLFAFLIYKTTDFQTKTGFDDRFCRKFATESIASQNRIFEKTRIVGGGIIESKMKSAAFVSRQCTIDNQACDGAQASQFEEIGGDPEVPIKFLNLALKIAQPGAGAQQSFFGANDSDVIPHEPTDLIPIVIDDNDFIDILGVARAPFGKIKGLMIFGIFGL